MPTPEELVSEWNANSTMNIVKFVLVTGILLTILILLFAVGNIHEISQNWPRYRCNPTFMPFAGAFGYSVKDNFQFCMNSMFKTKAGEVFAPIYGLLGNFTNTISLLVDTTLGMRTLFGNFVMSTNSFLKNVHDRIQGLLFQLRLTFMKMQHLMGRVYGSMYSMVWLGTSAVTAGMNLSENDMIKFIAEFCFDPATRVPMADDTIKLISDLRVGDILADNVRVTSTFFMDGTNVPMVEVQGVHLSSTHLVVGPTGTMIAAGDHPAAKPIPSIPRLICLNVEGHRFRTEAGLIVADYDESESPEAIQMAQQIAESALNGSSRSVGAAVRDYSLGLDETCELQMADGSWKPIADIQIGDLLVGRNLVRGLVKEECTNIVCIDGIELASAQLLHDAADGAWKRAANVVGSRTAPTSKILHHLITHNTGPIAIRNKSNTVLWVRDYREAPIPEMEDPYMKAVVVVE